MAKRVGLITINLLAGTAAFNTQMDAAKAKIKNLGSGVDEASKKLVSGNQAASGFIRVAEGGMANNLRAVENFMTKTLGLGPALQAIFPLVGAIAFAGLLFTMGKEVYAFFKKAEEGPARVANAFRLLNAPLQLTNDELRVANDRLDNDIAKLEGKRQNSLQLALDQARVAADKLADSLDKDLEGLNKLLKEENVNAFVGFFTDTASTSKLKEYFGGKTGYGGYKGEVDELTDKGRAKINAAAERGDKAGQDAAVKELDIALEKKRGQAILDTTNKLKEFQRLQAVRANTNALVRAVDPALDDETKNIELAKGALRQLNEEQDNARLAAQNKIKTDRKEKDEAANANARLSRPLDEKLAALDAQVTESAAHLAAAGASEAVKELMTAQANAVKAIQEVNKALKEQHEGPMSKASEGAIRLRETSIAMLNTETVWQTKLAKTTTEIEDRIASQKLLTAAVGEAYDVTRKASIAYQVMNEVGHERFNDPKWMADPKHKTEVAGIETRATSEFDEKHATETARTLDKLGEQIELEQKLAKVQIEGAEAVRLATLAVRIEKIARDNDAESAKKLIQAEKDLYAAERDNASAARLTVINLEIAATRRLAAAQIEGAESYRRAQLEVKYAAMLKAGDKPEEIAASRLEDELKHQQAVTGEVLKTANADRDRLRQIDAEAKAAILLKGTAADQLGIEIKLRDLENERLKILSQEYLQFGGLKDGVRSFFTEMQESARTTASIVKEALDSSLNDASSNLAKLITHQKTSFGAMFKSIGTQMVDATIKQQLQKGLGAIGQKLGIKPPGAKRDGQTVPGAILVQDVGKTAPAADVGAGAAADALGKLGDIFSGSQGGGIFNALAKGGMNLLKGLFGGGGDGLTPSVTSAISFGGMLAGGGDVTADKAYIVGDDGPEILRKTTGTVASNSQSKKLMTKTGGDHYYAIDARGTDPVLTEQRTRAAIMAAHNSAVGTSVQVQAEHMKRMPQR